jgi:hypothetical protein
MRLRPSTSWLLVVLPAGCGGNDSQGTKHQDGGSAGTGGVLGSGGVGTGGSIADAALGPGGSNGGAGGTAVPDAPIGTGGFVGHKGGTGGDGRRGRKRRHDRHLHVATLDAASLVASLLTFPVPAGGE